MLLLCYTGSDQEIRKIWSERNINHAFVSYQLTSVSVQRKKNFWNEAMDTIFTFNAQKAKGAMVKSKLRPGQKQLRLYY